jgi:adenylate cyclase
MLWKFFSLKRLWLVYSVPLILFAGLLSVSGVFERPDLWFLDRAFQWRGTQAPSNDIVIVAISKEDFENGAPRWPWPRSLIARLIDQISELQPSVIAIDILYNEETSTETLFTASLLDELHVPRACIYKVFSAKKCIYQGPDGNFNHDPYDPGQPGIAQIAAGLDAARAQDRELASAVKGAIGQGVDVVLATDLISNGNMFGVTRPYQELATAGGNTVGLVGVRPDRDGVLRMYLTYGLDQDEQFVYGLAPVAASKFKGVELPERPYDASFAGDFRSEVSNSQLLVNFKGPSGTYSTITALDVLAGEDALSGQLKDKIVFIGVTDPTAGDLHPTPFSGEEGLAGVEFQAVAADTLLSQSFIRNAPRYQEMLMLVLFGLGAISLGRFVRPVVGLVGLVALGVGVIGIWFFFFVEQSYLLPVASSLVVVLSGYTLAVIDRVGVEALDKQQARSMLSRYLHPGVVKELLKSPVAAQLGGKRSEITVLFSDIRGFTTLSEKLDPEEVVGLLNEYLAEMTDIIFSYDGTVDKFEGDAILAFFGAPQPCEDQAERAVKTALEMREHLAGLGDKWMDRTHSPLRIGIGINTGQAMCGNIGSGRRMEYTVIGDTVNLASRLQDLTKEYQVPILISGATQERVQHMCETHSLGSIQVRGREQSVDIFEVAGLKSGDPESEVAAWQEASVR